MILEIRNIGRFNKSTSIEINGITILAGENGIGKSTIGKALYCVYNSLYDYKTKILEERERSIFRLVRFVRQRSIPRIVFKKKIKEFLTEREDNEYSDELIKALVMEITGEDTEEIDETVVKKIKDVLSASESSILKAMIGRRIEGEFDSQISHINYQKESSTIKLIIKDKSIVINIDADGKVDIIDKINLEKDLIYIDDPYVVDELSNYSIYNNMTHRSDIIDKLRRKKEIQFSAVDEVLVDDKLRKVYEILENICGSITEKDDESYYSDAKLEEGISIKNLSTGMKSFIMLKSLLQKGYLEEKGIVVLDEPEAHLHPEWMLKYAEIVVLLQKVFDINFVISTHSSEFMSYIELYTKKYEIIDKCRYYLLEPDSDDETTTLISDCTNENERIYKKLSRPFIWANKVLDEEL